MANTKIQTTLISRTATAGLVNITDVQAETILALMKKFAPGMTNFLKGLRPISAEGGAPIPCVMVQPMSIQAVMNTTAKYNKHFPFDIWYVVGASSIEETVELATSAAEIFVKLFSNNALNDQGSGFETNSFKKYSGFGLGGFGMGPYGVGNSAETNWLDSEMSRVEWSVPFLSGRPGGPKYIAVGNFQLTTETQALV